MSSDLNSKQSQLLHKLSVTLISGGLLALALFLLTSLVFRFSDIRFITAFYILGFLAVFMLGLGLVSFLKYKSYVDESGSSFKSERTIKKDLLTRIGVTQILFGFALIIILHSLISIIIGLAIIIVAAFFLFFAKLKSR